jgi:hypothetical protein
MLANSSPKSQRRGAAARAIAQQPILDCGPKARDIIAAASA